MFIKTVTWWIWNTWIIVNVAFGEQLEPHYPVIWGVLKRGWRLGQELTKYDGDFASFRFFVIVAKWVWNRLNKMYVPNEGEFYPKWATTRKFDWGIRTKNVSLLLCFNFSISTMILVQNKKNAVDGSQICLKLSGEILDMSMLTRNLWVRSKSILLCGPNCLVRPILWPNFR